MKTSLGRHRCRDETDINCDVNCNSSFIFLLLNSPEFTTQLKGASLSIAIEICFLMVSEVDERLNVLLKAAAVRNPTNIFVANRNYANVMLGFCYRLRYT
jgi:hypothetical protein